MWRRHRAAIFLGLLGLVAGGLFGLILGVVAGLAVDRMRSDLGSGLSAEREVSRAGAGGDVVSASRRGAAFSVAAVVLSAKLAKVDGRVAAEEIRAFRRVFYVPPEELDMVARLFDGARRDALGYRAYSRELGRIFAGEPELLGELLEGLERIARADGEVSAAERKFLDRVRADFGIAERAIN
ncbi:MAG: TerB family tellurite resistance protein [Alphaproteobacteria bacterium]|nr:TerB family tellurite resistance protein [Alphaproteobacteria bacterium]